MASITLAQIVAGGSLITVALAVGKAVSVWLKTRRDRLGALEVRVLNLELQQRTLVETAERHQETLEEHSRKSERQFNRLEDKIDALTELLTAMRVEIAGETARSTKHDNTDNSGQGS